MPRAEVVKHHRLKAGAGQSLRGVAANVSRTASDQYARQGVLLQRWAPTASTRAMPGALRTGTRSQLTAPIALPRASRVSRGHHRTNRKARQLRSNLELRNEAPSAVPHRAFAAPICALTRSGRGQMPDAISASACRAFRPKPVAISHGVVVRFLCFRRPQKGKLSQRRGHRLTRLGTGLEGQSVSVIIFCRYWLLENFCAFWKLLKIILR
jgi:hypothetical protein